MARWVKMVDGSYRRKLSAIMSADVEGYSRLMEEDEEATIRTLTGHRTAMVRLIRLYRGRVVDTPGDNLLAEFVSAVEAVSCAAEIQRELAERNTELLEDRRMRFRIGINLGDIIEEGEKIYGDGVNIAARMEGLAEGGGICVSGTVYDAVENKLNLAFEYLGEQQVKNISSPVRAYRVMSFPGAAAHRVARAKKALQRRWNRVLIIAAVLLCAGALSAVLWKIFFQPPAFSIGSARKEGKALDQPEKPSIAVLPFTNMSSDPGQDYLSDGITESVITTLSKIPNLFVIARNSTFYYKGKQVKIQQAAAELGVRYVLEGSVQRTGDRIRVNAQLIDASTGSHLWADRYDRGMKDIFAVQDDITIEITRALRVELIEGDQARLWAKQETKNLEAYEKALQARALSQRGTRQDNTRARQLFGEAIELDPGFVSAYAALGWTYFWDARFGWSENKDESLGKAFEQATNAISLDDNLEDGHLLLAAIHLLRQDWDRANIEAERAVALNPNGADAYSVLAGIVSCCGRWEEGIAYAQRAIQLNPFPPVHYYHWLGRAYFMTSRYGEAVTTWRKALRVNPDYLDAHLYLAACFASMGRRREAAAEAAEVLRLDPEFSIDSYVRTLPFRNEEDIKRHVASLAKAGLPEKKAR
jgi:adenylate cyclase